MLSEQVGPIHSSNKNKAETKYHVTPAEPAPSVRFFTETAEGKSIRDRVMNLANSIFEKSLLEIKKDKDIHPLEHACSAIELSYYMGENYTNKIERLFSLTEERLLNPGLFNVHDTNKITDLYKNLGLPPDAITHTIKSHITDLITSGKINSNHHLMLVGEDSRILESIGIAHLNQGDTEEAYRIASLIRDPLEQSKLLFKCTEKTIDDPFKRQEVIDTFTRDVIDQKRKNKEGVLYIASAFSLRNNNMSAAQNYAAHIDAVGTKSYVHIDIAENLHKAGRHAEARQLLRDTQHHLVTIHKKGAPDQLSDEFYNYERLIASIAAAHLNQRRYSDAKKSLELIKDNHFDLDSFFEKIDPETLYLDPQAQDVLLEFIASPTFRNNQVRGYEGNGERGCGLLGITQQVFSTAGEKFLKKYFPGHLYNEVIDKVAEKELALILGHFKLKHFIEVCKGINTREYFKQRHPNVLLASPYESMSRVIHRDDVAFGLGIYLPNDFDTAPLPDHIKLAVELGKQIRFQKPESASLLELNDPQSIRAFLRGMEHYDFKSVPEALTTIIDTLPPESERVVYDYLDKNPRFAPRLLKTLVSVDMNQGGRYAINFMNRKGTPDRIFTYFCGLLAKEGRFSKHTTPLLEHLENIPHLRKLLSQHPNQFNNAIECMHTVGSTTFDQEPLIWEALRELSPISPRIYTLYRNASLTERNKLVERLKSFNYDDFFKNKPITLENLSSEQRELETELVFRAYNPVNMSYESVAALFPQVPDRSDDLKEYTVREHYPVSFKTPYFILKPGELLNQKTFERLEVLGSGHYPHQGEALDESLKSSILKLARATTDFTDQEAARLLGIMKHRHGMSILNKKIEDEKSGQTYNNLMLAREALGLIVKDYFASDLKEVLATDPAFSERISKILTSDARRKNLLFAMGYHEDNEFTQSIPVEQLVAELFSDKVLSKYVTLINREARKFNQTEQESESDQQARVFISKNKASFFAKSSAGLCTAGDLGLWNNPNHFHFNTVDMNNTVRGSTMGYLEIIEGKKALVLRGFNPTENYLNEISPDSFVKQMLSVAREFMNDNTISDLYITGGDGSFSSLTNRPAIQAALNKWIVRGKLVEHTIQLSSNSTTDKLLRLDNFDKWL